MAATYCHPRTLAAVLLLLTGIATPRVADSSEQAPVWHTLTAPWLVDGAFVRDSRRGRLLAMGNREFSRLLPAYESIFVFPSPTSSRFATLVPEGVGPLSRVGFSAVYDSLRDRVLVFGGHDPWSEPSDTLWELRLSPSASWRPILLPSPRPPARAFGQLWIDAVHDRLILYGGARDTEDPLPWAGDVWTLALDSMTTWRYRGESPAGARDHSASALLPGHRGVIVFGGYRPGPEGEVGFANLATWEVTFGDTLRWDVWPIVSPLERPNEPQAMCEGAQGIGPILFPGDYISLDPSGPPPPPRRFDVASHRWLPLDLVGSPPPNTHASVAVWDPDSDAVLALFSGSAAAYRIELAGPPAWRALGQSPSGATGSDFAGAPVEPSSGTVFSQWNDGAWAWNDADASGWNHLPWSWRETPLASVLVVDSVRSELLGIGRIGYCSGALDSAWAMPLDGSAFAHKRPYESPFPFCANVAASAWDGIRRRELIVTNGSQSLGEAPGLWAMDLGDTLRFHAVPSSGAPRNLWGVLGMTLETAFDRLFVLWSNLSLPYGPTELWQVSFSDSARWTRLDASGPGRTSDESCGIATDDSRARLLFFGSDDSGLFYDPFDLLPTPAWGARVRVRDLPYDRQVMYAFDPVLGRILVADRSGTLGAIELPDAPVPPRLFPELRARQGEIVVEAHAGIGAEFAARFRRSTDGGRTWPLVGVACADASGILSLRDVPPEPTSRVGYRITAVQAGAERTLSESWLDVTTPVRLRVRGVRPNPASGPFSIELALPSSSEVTLTLIDVSGRLAAPPWRESMSAGTHMFAAPWSAPLRPGLYLLRASDGRTVASSRLTVVR